MNDRPAIPYGRQTIDADDLAAVAAALQSPWLTTGPAVTAFEDALAQVTGGGPVVAVSSGTAALHAAYAAAGLAPGRSLLTTPLTFAGTAAAALHLGATVRFADVRDDTLNLDPAAVEADLEDVDVVCAVDYAGQPCDYDELRDLTDRSGALLVADAAHAVGGSYRGRPVGSLADLTTFSFHPVKTITTAEGGAVAVPGDADRLDAVRRFRNHGIVRDATRWRVPGQGGWHQEIQSLGLNYRLPDVLAALGTSQLRRLSAFVERRRQLVERYGRELSDLAGLRLPTVLPHLEPAWHLFVVRVLDGRRRALYDHLAAEGIHTQVHYLPVHLQPLFADLGFRRGSCPVAEQAYEEILSLPLFPGLTDADQDRVVESVRRFFGA